MQALGKAIWNRGKTYIAALGQWESLQRLGKAMTDFKEHDQGFSEGKRVKNTRLESREKALSISGKNYLHEVVSQPNIALRDS